MAQRPRMSPRSRKISIFSLLRRRRVLTLVFILLAALGYFFCSGKVVRVSDGDTLQVFSADTTIYKVRLYGIDSPESRQRGGAAATAFTREAALLQDVGLTVIDTDRYGRSVALVHLPDRRILNEELVRAGHAWVYRAYCDQPFCAGWILLEEEARKARRGLWADKKPTPPWVWREKQRGRH